MQKSSFAIQYPLTAACGFACTTKHWAWRRAALRRWQMQGGWRRYQDRNGRDPWKAGKRPQVRRLQVPQGCRQKLTLGCPVLDRLLRGGIPTGLITELAGAVLTDLLLQRSITACMLEFVSHWRVQDDATTANNLSKGVPFKLQARQQQPRRRHACSCCSTRSCRCARAASTAARCEPFSCTLHSHLSPLIRTFRDHGVRTACHSALQL